MGATTILYYLGSQKKSSNIIGCVVDSPYSDLFQLTKEITVSKTKVPGFIVENLLSFARSKILDEHQFDLYKMTPLPFLKKFSIPLLYITSVYD